MKKKWLKGAVLTAAVCLAAGALLINTGYRLGGMTGIWIDRDGIHSSREYYEKRVVKLPKTMLGQIDSLEVKLVNNQLVILPSEDGQCWLEYEMLVGKSDPVYEYGDGRLSFQYQETEGIQTWGLFVADGIREVQKGYVKIYIPQDTLLKNVNIQSSDAGVDISQMKAEAVTIKDGYGDVSLSGLETDSINVAMSDGSLIFSDITADTGVFSNSYGETSMENMKISGDLKITCSDGAVTVSNATAGRIVLENAYGSITGKNISAQVMEIAMSDGTCDLAGLDVVNGSFQNKYGNMELQLEGKEEDYTFDLKTRYGSIRVNDRSFGEDHPYDQPDKDAERTITTDSNDGSLTIVTDR